MIMGHKWLEEFSAVLWPALADHVLQATLITIICFLALPLFRRARARARHTLWLVAFVRFALPPVLVLFIVDRLGFKASMGIPMQQVSNAVSQVTQPLILAIQQTAAGDSSPGGHSELYCLLTLIWILGCLILLARWWLQHHRFVILLRTGGKECGAAFHDTIQILRKKLGMVRRKNFRVVSGNFEPGVWGVWRPVLVLPENISKKLEPDEVEAILAHELVHLRRWDNLWCNLQMLVCCIFWFHPLVWIIDRRLIAERERACDERVIEVLHDTKVYASSLIKITGLRLGLQVNGAASMAGVNLKARIENIMKDKTKRTTGWLLRLLLSAVTTLAILLYLFAAPLQESLAQSSVSKQAETSVESKSGDVVTYRIEDSQDSPLKILSPKSRILELPREAIEDPAITAVLAESGITVQNKSDHVINSFILEFKMPDSSFYYHAGIPAGIEPDGTFTLGTEQPLRFFKTVSDAGASSYVVRPAAAVFEDGDMWKLPSLPPPPAPAPPPPPGQSITGGIAGGVVGGFPGGIPGEALASPPPPGRSIPRGIAGGVVGGFPGGVVGEAPAPPPPPGRSIPRGIAGGVVGEANAPVPPPRPPQATAPEAEKVPVPPQAGLKQADGKLQMNFTDMDLNRFIESISQVLGLTPLVVDPAVQGTVTAQSSIPMTKEEVLALFNVILKRNNASLIHENGIYQVVPISSAPNAGVDPNQFIAHENEALKTVPKSVSVSIESSGEQAFDISRLDGSILVLEGDNRTYRSTPILTDGGEGQCKFDRPIPVGDYTLKVSIFNITVPFSIPDLPKNEITLKINLAKTIAMTFQ
jgi:beta-lactamase regulating signal transducer with metallopeptidase domain